MMTFGALQAIREANLRVGRDISLIGFGRTYFINVPGLLEQLGIGGDADGKSAGRDAVL